ncbi:hypothetical protein HKD37_12G034548 [Glycine soja]
MDPKKLATKKSRKNTAGEGSSTAPPTNFEFDGHRFCSEDHQCRFELIKDWSFLKERRVQLVEGEYPEFIAEITRRNWRLILRQTMAVHGGHRWSVAVKEEVGGVGRQLAEPMPKYDLKVVLEFYANSWPIEEGFLDKCSNVWGQWIPYDADAINQFLRNPLILEEGQQCEYTSRRGRTIAKHIRPPIGRSFIEKYCMPRQVQQLEQVQQLQPALDAPPPPQQKPSLESISAHLQRMELQMHTYIRHLANQQATNHRCQMQFSNNFYYYTLHQHLQDPNPYPWPTPEQFRATVAWPGDRLIFQEEACPTNA